MGSVLFGNGLIIQYGGSPYTNASIINRALQKIGSGNYPSHLYPSECAEMLRVLHREYPSLLAGHYDKYAVASFERSALEDFKRRYSSQHQLPIDRVSFEDYFLIFELLYNRLGIGNPDRFQARGVLTRMFLDAIYNNGAIQSVYRSFPDRLVEFVDRFEHVFTTNYDRNLDAVCAGDVIHLHGSFHVLSDVYDPDSFRNQLSDDLLNGEQVDDRFPHLYSTCLVSYVSDLKDYSIHQPDLANSAMERFAVGYENNPAMRRAVNSWDEGQPLLRRLKEAVKRKSQRPELLHSQHYPIKRLKEVTGRLTVIGLSPNNDNHIFQGILENASITSIDYYCFSRAEEEDAIQLFGDRAVPVKDVRELWGSFDHPAT